MNAKLMAATATVSLALLACSVFGRDIPPSTDGNTGGIVEVVGQPNYHNSTMVDAEFFDEHGDKILNRQRRAPPPPPYASCTTPATACTTLAAPLVYQCCSNYRLCCTEANTRVTCPAVNPTATTMAGTSTNVVNDCNKYGLFCRNDSDCIDGATKCCRTTSGASPIATLSCCWTVT